MEKTPVSLLQELMAIQHRPKPVYQEAVSGPKFTCTVIVDGVVANGVGISKKSAKHDSAKKALEYLGKTPTFANNQEISKSSRTCSEMNYIGVLNEFSSKNGLTYPVYNFVSISVNGVFSYECFFLDQHTIGSASTKRDAKQESAKQMLQTVKNNKLLHKLNISNIKTNTAAELPTVTAEKNKAFDLIKELSLDHIKAPKKQNPILDAIPEPEIELSDDIKELKEQLDKYNVSYTLEIMQSLPIIAILKIKETSVSFMSVGKTANEAIRDVLKQAVRVKKIGIALDENLNLFTAQKLPQNEKTK